MLFQRLNSRLTVIEGKRHEIKKKKKKYSGDKREIRDIV